MEDASTVTEIVISASISLRFPGVPRTRLSQSKEKIGQKVKIRLNLLSSLKLKGLHRSLTLRENHLGAPCRLELELDPGHSVLPFGSAPHVLTHQLSPMEVCSHSMAEKNQR